MLYTILLIIVLSIFTTLLSRKARRRPPGPPGYPFIGNLLSIPLQHPWEVLATLTQYGDIVYYHGLGNSILVLNSLESMTDLLVKKGNTYCSRPYFTVASELMDLINSTAFTPFGERWKLHRKFTRSALSPQVVMDHEPTLVNIAELLRKSLREDPNGFDNHVRLAAGRIIMGTIYGIGINSAEDPYIRIAESAMNMISKAVVPGAFIVDLVPPLKYLPKWMPFTTFHDVGLNGRMLVSELIQKPFNHVKTELAAGTAKRSFTADVLTNEDLNSEREATLDFEDSLKWAAASMYAAGQEVISSSILTMIMAMATSPDKLTISQAELDRVVGPDRDPTTADRDSLPYIHAVVKETLRWHPPLPMDIARSSIEDDYYRGNYGNSEYMASRLIDLYMKWKYTRQFRAISRAPDPQYPPDVFAPERFLRKDPALDPSAYCFGFGRRICPGRLLAEHSIFLMTAYILHSFDIAKFVDEKGNDVPIHTNYSSGLVSLPEPFLCKLEARRRNNTRCNMSQRSCNVL